MALQTQMGTPLLVEEMLTELVQDNIEIIHVIDERDVDEIIKHLNHKKDPNFLRFLSVLCVCEDSAVHGKQARHAMAA
jgi:hypothetical protein